MIVESSVRFSKLKNNRYQQIVFLEIRSRTFIMESWKRRRLLRLRKKRRGSWGRKNKKIRRRNNLLISTQNLFIVAISKIITLKRLHLNVEVINHLSITWLSRSYKVRQRSHFPQSSLQSLASTAIKHLGKLQDSLSRLRIASLVTSKLLLSIIRSKSSWTSKTKMIRIKIIRIYLAGSQISQIMLYSQNHSSLRWILGVIKVVVQVLKCLW